MTLSIPDYTLPLTPSSWIGQQAILTFDWDAIPALPPFILFDGSKPALQQTTTRVCCDQQALYVRFDCEDTDIWGTFTKRDQPIYDEEVVELFLAPGIADPTRYYEFEISPNGVLFDAEILNPTSKRPDMTINTAWDCDGIQWQAARDDAENRWAAAIVIPWQTVAPAGALLGGWRANFYRIERPRHAEPEYSCWSPTMVSPADFHQPAYFGILRLPPQLLGV